jgi:hypothetical protein
MTCSHPSSLPAADPLQRGMTEAVVGARRLEAQP